jgi:O-acetyl-ADP-ribose deacetylase (regulator of RNase III)
MRVALWDINPEVVFAWTQVFSGCEDIRIGSGNILKANVDSIVSPTNSFGYMDGGIDLAYRNFFGVSIQSKVRAVIQNQYKGEIPVGSAFAVSTGHPKITRLIVAPTMRTPRPIHGTENVYLATRAALLCALDQDPPMHVLGFPGVGTGVGGMDPFESAEQMLKAYKTAFQETAAP